MFAKVRERRELLKMKLNFNWKFTSNFIPWKSISIFSKLKIPFLLQKSITIFPLLLPTSFSSYGFQFLEQENFPFVVQLNFNYVHLLTRSISPQIVPNDIVGVITNDIFISGKKRKV
jgi:hypothetical protein